MGQGVDYGFSGSISYDIFCLALGAKIGCVNDQAGRLEMLCFNRQSVNAQSQYISSEFTDIDNLQQISKGELVNEQQRNRRVFVRSITMWI